MADAPTPRVDTMATAPSPSVDMQHKFLDEASIRCMFPLIWRGGISDHTKYVCIHVTSFEAKAFNWSMVQSLIKRWPELLNAQPGGRWSALHQAAWASHLYCNRNVYSHVHVYACAYMYDWLFAVLYHYYCRVATPMQSQCCWRQVQIASS
jgi:hypothetical protein